MKNIEIVELTAKQWAFYAHTTPREHSALPGIRMGPPKVRVGKRTRRVYVHPDRYCVCAACIRTSLEEDLG